MPIGDHLRDVMDLYGSPKCPHTNAVLIAAGEKGVDINSHVEDDWGPSSSIRSMSPLGIGPVLKDRSAVNIGVVSCMSYLDDKGFGPSLVHRNGVTRARMFQEITIAQQTDCSDDAALAAAALGKEVVPATETLGAVVVTLTEALGAARFSNILPPISPTVLATSLGS